MSCECKCSPGCDGLTSFCANDTGKPAHCVCNYGYQKIPNKNPKDIVTCEIASDAATPAPIVLVGDSDEGLDPDLKDDLKIAQIVTIIWLLIWLGAILVIFFLMCHFKPDRVIHMQEEITLIITFVLVILAAEDPSSEGACKAFSIMLHYFFTCTMVFFCLEALHAYSIITFMVPFRGYLHPMLNLAFGYGIPIIPVGISVGVFWDNYGTDKYHCWCQVDTTQAWGFIFPIGFLGFVCTVIAEAQGQGKYKELPDSDMTEYTTARVSQGSIMIIMPMCLVSYIFGLIAIDLQNEYLWVIFCIVNVILGPVIFFFHCIGHPKARAMMSKMCACLPCLKEKRPFDHDDDRPMTGRSTALSPLDSESQDGSGNGVAPADSDQGPGVGGSGSDPSDNDPSFPEREPKDIPDTKDTDWKNFYKWVSDGKKDNVHQAENVLFDPATPR